MDWLYVSGLGQEGMRERASRMAWARCAPLGDVQEFGETSALDGSVGRDVWIVPPVLQADVSQMVGEGVHDGFRSLAHAGGLKRVLAEKRGPKFI